MRAIALVLAAALATAPAGAKTPPAEPEKPITQKDVTPVEVVATPVTDLNLRKGEIPQVLLDAQFNPYATSGMTSCNRIASAVTALDTVLGDDLDITADSNVKPQAGRVAQSVVASFIPFRGVIREISGASAQQRKVNEAILAGSARRGFLKGLGMQRGCHYPAHPATPEIAARRLAQIAAAAAQKDERPH